MSDRCVDSSLARPWLLALVVASAAGLTALGCDGNATGSGNNVGPQGMMPATDGGTPPSTDGGPQMPGPGRWEALPAMPGPGRFYVGVAAVGTRVFVVGGFGSGPESSTVTAYDTKAGTWATLATLPSSFQMPNVAAAGGKLYVLGALDNTATLEYDPAADKWLPRAAVPVPRGRGQSGVGVWGNKILIAGGVIPGKSANGLNTGVRQREVLAYDTTTDTWEPYPNLALTRGYCMGAVIGDRFFVMGGSSDFARTDDVTVLDLNARTWMDQPMLPISLSSAAVTALNGWVYLLGGVATSNGTIGPATLVLDPMAGAFVTAEVMITPRFGMGAAAVDGRIYVPAGIAADPDPKVMFKPVTNLEVFIP
jgi:hypothetical protein